MEKYSLSNNQYKFIEKLLTELEPIDNLDFVSLKRILSEGEYNKFDKMILINLRARYIRQKGLHNNDPKLNDELNKINTTR